MSEPAAAQTKRSALSGTGIGNAIAAIGMGYFLWRSHPELQRALKEHPLGEPADQGVDEPAAR